ncbi:MAG: class I SAM-dependent methyltransferase [Planctomycetes bacterium]|nr:class I SAM-dependent methyltransferase [Planctomycetota bacterium]
MTHVYGTPDDAPSTAYFQKGADDYARYRPTYAPAAVDLVLEGLDPPARALDVGCGTGIFSRLLAARGARVVGVDPSHDMLEEARRAPPVEGEGAVEYRLGTAESTGLPDASRDLVTCAQAFHWFDAAKALKELHRVLLRGGRLALVWNVRAEGDAFTAEYDEVVRRAQAAAKAAGRKVEVTRDADPTLGGWFEGVRVQAFDNAHALDLDGLLGRARSASYFPKAGPLREDLEAALRAAFERHAREGRVALAQRTEVTLATRVDRRR